MKKNYKLNEKGEKLYVVMLQYMKLHHIIQPQ
jgi:hypothetical protein